MQRRPQTSNMIYGTQSVARIVDKSFLITSFVMIFLSIAFHSCLKLSFFYMNTFMRELFSTSQLMVIISGCVYVYRIRAIILNNQRSYHRNNKEFSNTGLKTLNFSNSQKSRKNKEYKKGQNRCGRLYFCLDWITNQFYLVVQKHRHYIMFLISILIFFHQNLRENVYLTMSLSLIAAFVMNSKRDIDHFRIFTRINGLLNFLKYNRLQTLHDSAKLALKILKNYTLMLIASILIKNVLFSSSPKMIVDLMKFFVVVLSLPWFVFKNFIFIQIHKISHLFLTMVGFLNRSIVNAFDFLLGVTKYPPFTTVVKLFKPLMQKTTFYSQMADCVSTLLLAFSKNKKLIMNPELILVLPDINTITGVNCVFSNHITIFVSSLLLLFLKTVVFSGYCVFIEKIFIYNFSFAAKKHFAIKNTWKNENLFYVLDINTLRVFAYVFEDKIINNYSFLTMFSQGDMSSQRFLRKYIKSELNLQNKTCELLKKLYEIKKGIGGCKFELLDIPNSDKTSKNVSYFIQDWNQPNTMQNLQEQPRFPSAHASSFNEDFASLEFAKKAEGRSFSKDGHLSINIFSYALSKVLDRPITRSGRQKYIYDEIFLNISHKNYRMVLSNLKHIFLTLIDLNIFNVERNEQEYTKKLKFIKNMARNGLSKYDHGKASGAGKSKNSDLDSESSVSAFIQKKIDIFSQEKSKFLQKHNYERDSLTIDEYDNLADKVFSNNPEMRDKLYANRLYAIVQKNKNQISRFQNPHRVDQTGGNNHLNSSFLQEYAEAEEHEPHKGFYKTVLGEFCSTNENHQPMAIAPNNPANESSKNPPSISFSDSNKIHISKMDISDINNNVPINEIAFNTNFIAAQKKKNSDPDTNTESMSNIVQRIKGARNAKKTGHQIIVQRNYDQNYYRIPKLSVLKHKIDETIKRITAYHWFNGIKQKNLLSDWIKVQEDILETVFIQLTDTLWILENVRLRDNSFKIKRFFETDCELKMLIEKSYKLVFELERNYGCSMNSEFYKFLNSLP